MKSYTLEVTKVIVVTVKARSFEGACKAAQEEFNDGEYGGSWDRAEPRFDLIGTEAVK